MTDFRNMQLLFGTLHTTIVLCDYSSNLWLVALCCVNAVFLLQLDSKAELELKGEDEDDYAMNSESYLEVRFFMGYVE